MAAARPVTVAVVNDYALVVAGLTGVLAPFDDRVEVVEVDSGMPVRRHVDVVLYDSFGQPQGAAVQVGDLLPSSSSRLLVFSWNTDPDLVRDSFDAGAHGYVSKASSAEELVEAIERVARGERVAPADGPEDDRFGRWPGDEHGLSAREAEVLALICQGLSNKDLGAQAHLGANTVKSYIRSLYRKIGVESRTQAVLWGLDHGFDRDRLRRYLDQSRDHLR